jgi:hypothetical protein
MTDRPRRRYSPGRTSEFRAQTVLVQHLAYREISHRRNVARSHIVKMVCSLLLAYCIGEGVATGYCTLWVGRGTVQCAVECSNFCNFFLYNLRLYFKASLKNHLQLFILPCEFDGIKLTQTFKSQCT